MKTAIWWIRRDLRLSDNQALTAALHQANTVIPVFILDPGLLASPYAGEARKAFLFSSLRALDTSLRSRGSALIIRMGMPLEVLQTLCTETGAEGIFAEADRSPYATLRDGQVERVLPIHLFSGITVQTPDILLKSNGSPYTVFTPFSRMWRSLPFPGNSLAAPERFPALPALSSLELPSSPCNPDNNPFPAGETEAQRRLSRFVDFKIQQYAENRNRMDLEGTSGLSPYLRFGMISARQAVLAVRQIEPLIGEASARQGVETWLTELIWREFYSTILYHFPYVRRMAFRPGLRNIPWRDAPADFSAWCKGLTGYPVVDAAMRQLNTTGWMHNRARMIAASFLTKDLLIDWRQGELYFMQRLLDGDPASNNGGWQWAAGTGTDAAPYFRIFNPVLQGQKFDPHGDYVRRWVPELADIPERCIHTPWVMPEDIQKSAGCRIGKDYPFPIVDHQLARQRALDAYRMGE